MCFVQALDQTDQFYYYAVPFILLEPAKQA